MSKASIIAPSEVQMTESSKLELSEVRAVPVQNGRRSFRSQITKTDLSMVTQNRILATFSNPILEKAFLVHNLRTIFPFLNATLPIHAATHAWLLQRGFDGFRHLCSAQQIHLCNSLSCGGVQLISWISHNMIIMRFLKTLCHPHTGLSFGCELPISNGR